MSNALAIAAVSAVMKDLLDNAFVDASINAALGASVRVTLLAPDLVGADSVPGPQLNLYLYRVSPNSGWRNAALPSRSANGARLTEAPLALDLHYLLSAHGTQDFEAKILLGYAMQQFHERPVLTRDAMQRTLAAPSVVGESILPPAFAALRAADLADRVELVKIAPEPLGIEELSKLWSAFQTLHRPSVAYIASVVLIEARQRKQAALPVLTVGLGDRGPTVVTGLVPPVPTLQRLVLPSGNPSAYLGDRVWLGGHHLAGDAATAHTAELVHARLPDPISIVAVPADVSDDEIAIDLALAAAIAPAGIYTITVLLTRDGTAGRTNTLPLVLAPRVNTIAVATAGHVSTFTVQTTPEVRPGQRTSPIVGSREALAEPHAASGGTLSFRLDDVGAGTNPVRLRVDGAERVLVDRAATPPVYLPSQQVTV